MADTTFHPNPIGNGLLPFCMRLRRTEGYPPLRTHTLSIHFPDLLAKLGVFQGRMASVQSARLQTQFIPTAACFLTVSATKLRFMSEKYISLTETVKRRTMLKL